MSRSTADVLAHLEALVPPAYLSAEPLLGGAASAFATAEAGAASAAAALSIGAATGKWLDLLGLGLGMPRQAGETDAAYRVRLQTPPGGVTRPSILAAVNALLADYGSGGAVMVEWWEGLHFDADYYDSALYVPAGRAWFALAVPLVGTGGLGTDYYDSAYFDSMYVGGDGLSAVYGAIIGLVNAIKAAGVSWKLYIDATGAIT